MVDRCNRGVGSSPCPEHLVVSTSLVYPRSVLPMTEEERLDLLTQGLLGDAHKRIWDVSPEFHAQIYTLARMLPMWVKAMAQEAEELQRRREHLIRNVMYGQT